MPSLKIEDYVFRIVENQRRLFDYLDARASEWNWDVDLEDGVLTFSDAASGRALLTCPAFLLGTQTDTGSWMWGWANPSVSLPAEPRARFDRLRAEAGAAGLDHLTVGGARQLGDPSQGTALAITAAGALGCFTLYAGGYDGGAALLAVGRCPEVEAAGPLAPLAQINTATQALAAIEFDHRVALEAWLGAPVGASTEDTVLYQLSDGRTVLSAKFDGLGRLAEMGAELRAEAAP